MTSPRRRGGAEKSHCHDEPAQRARHLLFVDREADPSWPAVGRDGSIEFLSLCVSVSLWWISLHAVAFAWAANVGGAAAYPCCTNHSQARRSASSTGRMRQPSSRSALADDAHIFFLPMRTASIVTRGSRRSSRPVNAVSHTALTSATPYGSF